jgi:hypothetical protein
MFLNRSRARIMIGMLQSTMRSTLAGQESQTMMSGALHITRVFWKTEAKLGSLSEHRPVLEDGPAVADSESTREEHGQERIVTYVLGMAGGHDTESGTGRQ